MTPIALCCTRQNGSAGRARTNKRTDGRYQVHYLPALWSIKIICPSGSTRTNKCDFFSRPWNHLINLTFKEKDNCIHSVHHAVLIRQVVTFACKKSTMLIGGVGIFQKPCKLEKDGVEITDNTTQCIGMNSTCSVGPYDITMGGSEYKAWYCQKGPSMVAEYVSDHIIFFLSILCVYPKGSQ